MDAFQTTELIEKVIASRFDCNSGAFPGIYCTTGSVCDQNYRPSCFLAVVDIEVVISEAPCMLMRASPATGGSNTYVTADQTRSVQMEFRVGSVCWWLYHLPQASRIGIYYEK
ncbi:hypothetical protein D3C80_1215720 [compost metagenome]